MVGLLGQRRRGCSIARSTGRVTVSRRDLMKCALSATAVAGLGGVLVAAPSKATADGRKFFQVNIKDYGATGDGVTDDTVAIHSARDAAGVSGIVVIPPGTFVTTGLLLNVGSQVWHLMPGAIIKSRGSGSSAGPITVDAAFVTITGGGTVDGNRSVIGGNAHVWSGITGTVNASDLTVDGVTVQDTVFYGVWGQASRTRVLRCTFRANHTVPIMLSSYYLAVQLGSTMQDTVDMEASDNYIDRADEDPATLANAAIQIRGNDDPAGKLHATYRGKALRNTIRMPVNPTEPSGRVCGIEFGAYSYHGLAEGNRVENGTMGISFARGNYGKAIGNTLVGQTLYGIEIADSPFCTVQDNVIDGAGRLGSLPSGSGITTDGRGGLSTDTRIVGNRVFGLHDSGRSISLSAARVSVVANTIESVYGMNLTKVSDATLRSNVILGKGSGSGIDLVNCNDVTVADNSLEKHAVGIRVYASAGVVDHFTISNNRFRKCPVPVDQVLDGGTIGTNLINTANVVSE